MWLGQQVVIGNLRRFLQCPFHSRRLRTLRPPKLSSMVHRQILHRVGDSVFFIHSLLACESHNQVAHEEGAASRQDLAEHEYSGVT